MISQQHGNNRGGDVVGSVPNLQPRPTNLTGEVKRNYELDRSKEKGQQLQLVKAGGRRRPILDLNRPQGSRSWSLGMVSSTERNG